MKENKEEKYWKNHFVCYFCGNIYNIKLMSDNDLVCKYCKKEGKKVEWNKK